MITVSKPAVKHFAKVFGNKLQLDERDFSITVDNAKDVCVSHGGA
jgi:hypothetical protein